MFGDIKHHGRVLPATEYHFQHSRRVGKEEYLRHHQQLDGFIVSESRRALANFIANERMEKHVGDWSIEYRFDLYVFNPDVFWGIVESTAMEYASRMRPPIEPPG